MGVVQLPVFLLTGTVADGAKHIIIVFLRRNVHIRHHVGYLKTE